MTPSPTAPDEQPRTTRAETRRKHRQDLIVAATEAELERAGIHGTTLEQVGERVGLSRAALYYYVDSRDDLLTLVLDDVFQQQIAESDHIAGPDATPLERLRAFVHGSIRIVVERPAGRMIVSHLDLLAAHEPSALLMRHQERYARELIADAVADGSLRPVEQAAAIAVLFGTIATIPRGYNPDGRLTLEAVVNSALDLLLEGWLEEPTRGSLGR
jgi:AcrR family transcriptional regulator